MNNFKQECRCQVGSPLNEDQVLVWCFTQVMKQEWAQKLRVTTSMGALEWAVIGLLVPIIAHAMSFPSSEPVGKASPIMLLLGLIKRIYGSIWQHDSSLATCGPMLWYIRMKSASRRTYPDEVHMRWLVAILRYPSCSSLASQVCIVSDYGLIHKDGTVIYPFHPYLIHIFGVSARVDIFGTADAV